MGFLFCLIVVVFMVGLDQAVKLVAETHLKHQGSVRVIKNVFQLTYCENTGAAWSVMRGSRWIFVAITVAAVALMIFLLKKGYFKNAVGKLGVLLIIGGALGNLIDRIFRGYVIDVFDFVLIHFPVFNVADICITVGGILWAVYFLFMDSGKNGNKIQM